METLWFWLVAFLLTGYVLLDGFDLGAGLLLGFIARNSAERAAVIRSIGPLWDGNEVWLLAAGGSLFCAFPVLYATAFSGFYLPLMMVLWLIVGRALGIEFRHQIDHPLWTSAWDVVFSLSSALLALFFGVALGNVVRGVPLDEHGLFFAPLWTDFSARGATGILDLYTILAGLTAAAALAQHGALWVALKTEGELQARARRAATTASRVSLVLTVVLTISSRFVQPHIAARFSEAPWGILFPLAAAAGFALSRIFLGRGRDLPAFLGSCLYLAGLLAAVAFSLYPFVLPASTLAARGLTVHNAAADPHGLKVALAWWLPGMMLAAGYFVFVYRKFAGKVSADPHEGY